MGTALIRAAATYADRLMLMWKRASVYLDCRHGQRDIKRQKQEQLPILHCFYDRSMTIHPKARQRPYYSPFMRPLALTAPTKPVFLSDTKHT